MTKLQADIEQYINEKLARGDFHSRDEFTEEAIRVYRELENQHDELRTEIQRRIQRVGQGDSQPLDRGAFKAEARKRLAEEG